MKFAHKIILLVAIIIIAVAFFLFFYNKNMSSSDSAKVPSNIMNEIKETNILSSNIVSIGKQNTENEIANFSTNLFGDDNRIENIRLTCNAINGFTLQNGKTFSFNDVVGQPTADKGYKEADVIIGTKTEKGLGGGNCQVSTTIYNAILKVPEIEVIERNPHKKKVAYVEEGKDASVSYGVLDLKFKNNTGSPIKIYANADDKSVNVKINSLK